MPQLEQDVLEEPRRDPLRVRDLFALDVPLALGRGELRGGSQGIVGLGGDAHTRIV